MKKLFASLACAGILLACICFGQQPTTKTGCEYKLPSKLDMLSQRWINTYTEIRNGSFGYTIYPAGYFQLNENKTYSRYSNGDSLAGKWQITPACQLFLDEGAQFQRRFDIIKLTSDTLIVTRKDNRSLYIQHYKSAPTTLLVMLQYAKRVHPGFYACMRNKIISVN